MPRKSKVDKHCIECKDENIKTKLDTLRKIYLCEACQTSDKYVLIYKTHAKRDYFIDPDELVNCVTYHRKIRSTVTTLFRKCDILDYFCDQYNIDRNNSVSILKKQNELFAMKEKQKEERKRKKISNKTSRESKLVEELKKYGLKLRSDSKLCKGYIDGTIKDWSIKEIVNRMCEMRYLYDYCDMDGHMQKAYEDQQDEYAAGYFPDCTVFEQAELTALQEYGGYPKQWPWLKN